ncbi:MULTISPECIES: metal-sulfur cluster assembly factor [Bacillus]|uniref:DNA methyltransferase n=1 Tax=Bacillus wiedmannii TaxID=1890302 RepID=A0A2C4JHR4_9BACI|nr:metal-sulfur cluster assembly factor [Bacillus wiedmannii]OUB46954.1 DNA methyltransferase [Bacillus thuringiensis serovar argentinensis]KMP96946.1 DNA methyltransferase [Bacillus wiedmannii]MCU5517239.1 metal-sulfur cluster assembly factor [Bacillus wiedmannii]MCU5703729.1 metal-sulfur cluster assembly factor [Bacillus wiedmannii]MED3123182.1 metal-sulfur cluster assembly factor [Bacillus wiedmannii]
MSQQAFEEKLYANLEAVIDPELGVDIVNLGLVYDVTADENNNAVITMTMTSIGCPMAGQIISDVKKVLSTNVPEVNEIEVNVVWNPPWSKERMSRMAKIALGVRD